MKSFDYFAPQSLGDATALLRRHGTKAKLLAGGTDLFIRLERRAVEPGDGLIILEAMKMENEFNATVRGTVREIRVQVGQAVNPGDVLVVIE